VSVGVLADGMADSNASSPCTGALDAAFPPKVVVPDVAESAELPAAAKDEAIG
jgi:hypothetical protein